MSSFKGRIATDANDVLCCSLSLSRRVEYRSGVCRVIDVWLCVVFDCLCIFVIASWSEFKSVLREEKRKPESILSHVQHLDHDSLDQFC